MQVIVDDYRFDFPKAIEAYKFDDKDNISPHYHGVDALKAVDVMVEFPNEYLFIEIKTYDDLAEFHRQGQTFDGNEARKYLIRTLSRKYRETFLYRYCERKTDKPIFYICLLNIDNALKSYCKKELAHYIPVGKANHKRWNRVLLPAENLFIVDENAWMRNANLSAWGTCQYLRLR